jgi:hypothetical protein
MIDAAKSLKNMIVGDEEGSTVDNEPLVISGYIYMSIYIYIYRTNINISLSIYRTVQF